MPPRLAPARSLRALCVRTRASDRFIPSIQPPSRRCITEKERPLPTTDQPDKPGPNQEQLPHVSEEAAETSKIMGETGPEISQGTPIQEVLNRDEKTKENAPKIMQQQADQAAKPSGTRSYSTSARRRQEGLIQYEDETALTPGHKFGLPALPLGPRENMKFRYEPIVKQFTGLIMVNGEMAKAQTNVARILNNLRMSPPPKITDSKPILPDAPPSQHLPLNPVLYLQLAIDSVAPLLKIRSVKGVAGGGAALPIPYPLGVRHRRSQAIRWILDSASKKPSKGSGDGQFAQRVADEIIAIVEGRSGVWEKRLGIHRVGTAARANSVKYTRMTGKAV